MHFRRLVAAVAIACTANLVAHADEVSHLYNVGDRVVLWVNNVGPYNNPQESYKFFSLPWCSRDLTEEEQNDPNLERLPHIGEILHGVDHVYSRLPIFFGRSSAEIVCQQTLDDASAAAFDRAIRKQYWYQMHLDDLPIWGMVGELVAHDESARQTQRGSILGFETYIYTHKAFVVGYNGKRIISVNMTADDPVLVRTGATLEFSYSVEFVLTDENFDQRFVRYLDNDFFQHQIHWFSILNAFMMVLFLCGVVAVILVRTLKRDYAKYNLDASELGAFGVSSVDDSGWKQVHGDVFRSPSDLVLLSVALGNGVQLITLFLVVALASVWGSYYMNRGATAKLSLLAYAFTTVISGFVSGRFYKLHRAANRKPEGDNSWKVVMFLNGGLLPGCGIIMLIYLNCFSLWYSTLNVVPFGSLALIGALVLMVCVPLSIVGTFAARYVTGQYCDVASATKCCLCCGFPVPRARFRELPVSFFVSQKKKQFLDVACLVSSVPPKKLPCRVAAVARRIEPRKWYLSVFALVPVAGLLPFGSIFIEMYFMFSSFWNYKFYYVYGFLLLVFLILVCQCGCCTNCIFRF